MRAGANNLAPGTLPNDFMRRLDALRPRIDPETGQNNRGSTPPSQTADRFLSGPENAATVSRALDGTPASARGHAALRDYLRSNFANSALNADGTVNPRRAVSWADSMADVLATVPAFEESSMTSFKPLEAGSKCRPKFRRH